MRDKLPQVVEDVRSQHFSDLVDQALAEKVLDIETTHVTDRPRARENVERAIKEHLSGGTDV
jgi:hypothetical protein